MIEAITKQELFREPVFQEKLSQIITRLWRTKTEFILTEDLDIKFRTNWSIASENKKLKNLINVFEWFCKKRWYTIILRDEWIRFHPLKITFNTTLNG